MRKTPVRGVTKFRDFKRGNVVKVVLTSKQEMKGLYAGDVKFEAQTVRMNRVQKGQYIVTYNVETKKPVVMDVIDYCRENNLHIQEVGSSRLPKALSDYLRAYHKEYDKYQMEQHKALEAIMKSEEYVDRLREAGTEQLPEAVQKELEEDYYKQNPIEYIRKQLKSVKVFEVFEPYRGRNDVYEFSFDFADTYATGADLGTYTDLEYDDTRYLGEEPNQEITEKYLHAQGYTKTSMAEYTKLANKHKKVAKFSDRFYSAYVRDGKGDRVIAVVSFKVELKGIHKLKEKELESLVNDLNILSNQVSYRQKTNRRW